MPAATAVCPRCGFQGPTVGYFTQGGHIAGLVLLALVTSFPFFGAGGLLFYLLRHNYRSCARCGETLGKRDALALMAAQSHGAPLTAAAAAEADLPEDVGAWSSFWGIGSVLLYMFAAFMTFIAVVEEPELIVLAGMAAGAGFFMQTRARALREERRAALLTALQQPVLRLAGERSGRLTVTEVASSLGWPLRRAEKVLNSLEDGLRVASDVTPEGVIVYEFRELMHANRRVSAAEMDSLLIPGQTQAERPAAQAQPLPLPHDGTLSA
ncbi:MAG TPA: hypothetical protein VF142_21240 [Longimicrobium sp.]